MRCIFINLDRAPGRRAQIEAGFNHVAPKGWELVRFPAVDGLTLGELPGPTTAGEVGCFLSHRNAIASTLDDDQPVFIVEDDVVFSDRTFAAIEAKMSRPDWDILFTEVLPVDPNLIVWLARNYADKARRSAFERIPLQGRSFAGSAAYVVNGPSKARVVKLLDEAGTNVRPFDLLLREFGQQKRLAIWAIFRRAR